MFTQGHLKKKSLFPVNTLDVILEETQGERSSKIIPISLFLFSLDP